MIPAGGAKAVLMQRRSTAASGTAVERREAQRARSRRFAQADRSVARATPEARASGNIRPRGVAHDPGASRRSTPFLGVAFVSLAFGKARTQKMRRENEKTRPFGREEEL
jgi:hypothetical protein